MIYGFGSYTLDTDRYELRDAGRVCPLEPQAVDILTYLVQHCDRVVTKHELLEHLWPDRVVGEGILAQRLMTIRKAIGDSGRSQHCIKTLHGRGYRFAAAVAIQANANSAADASGRTSSQPASLLSSTAPTSDHATASAAPAPLFNRPPHFVGRDAELAQLAKWWAKAQQGMRQIGFIVGEPGIGKTALVDTFVAQVADTHSISVGRGQCVEDYGTGEPYLPVLEALGRLCRGADGDRFVSTLRRCAPSWLAHLPAVMHADGDTSMRTSQGLTPTQMLRELTDALEALTTARPLLLVLEDLHWSDRATLAWLAYMARRRDPARILILATYRPGEFLGHAHPLRSLLAELQPHTNSAELRLQTLTAPAVAAYLRQRCTLRLAANVPELIHDRTSGHPLFLVAMVDELVREKLLETQEGDADNLRDGAALNEMVPTSLRQYIEQHLERLPEQDQLLLEAASAAGSTFTVAAVSAGVAQAPEMIEARYAALARQGRFIRTCSVESWPDGTTTSCYEFKHALYHEVVYARVPEGRRVRLHQRIGARKEQGYKGQTQKIAAELAVHFARGRDVGRAVHYLYGAADNAVRRSAYQETIALVTQGLELLRCLPDTVVRGRDELRFLTTLGLALVATKGQAHAEVESTYARARALCRQLEDPPQLFLVLVGLFSCYAVRAELRAAADVGEQIAGLAERQSDTALRLVAHFALGQTSLFRGALAPARVHLAQGIALYDRKAHHGLGARAGFPGDLGVFCGCFDAHTLWHLGYPDQAVQRVDDALALADELGHPFSRALALAYASMLYQFRREAGRALEVTQTAIALCREQGFAYYLAWVTILQGWALTARAHSAEGIAQMQSGLTAMRATGAKLREPYYLALLADACGQAGESELGLTLLADALAKVRDRRECWQEAELHRLQGELLLHAGGRDAEVTRAGLGCRFPIDPEAEQCLHRALAIARAQQSKSLELRAAISLARCWQQQNKRAGAYELLAPIYDWFAEGFETADLRDAKVLLDKLG